MLFTRFLLALVLLLSLSSYSTISEKKPPILTKQEQRYQQKKQRLIRRFTKAQRPQRKERLQQQLQRVEQQQLSKKKHPLALWSFVIGVLSITLLFPLLILFFVILFTAWSNSAHLAMALALALTIAVGVLGLSAIILASFYFGNPHSRSNQYQQGHAALVGLVLGIIGFLIFGALMALRI